MIISCAMAHHMRPWADCLRAVVAPPYQHTPFWRWTPLRPRPPVCRHSFLWAAHGLPMASPGANRMVCPFHGLHRTKVRHVSSRREHAPTPLNRTRLPYMHCQCWQHFSPDGILLLLVRDIVFAMHVDVPPALNCTVLDSRQQCLLALRLVP